jgi:hypothetical protein
MARWCQDAFSKSSRDRHAPEELSGGAAGQSEHICGGIEGHWVERCKRALASLSLFRDPLSMNSPKAGWRSKYPHHLALQTDCFDSEHRPLVQHKGLAASK